MGPLFSAASLRSPENTATVSIKYIHTYKYVWTHPPTQRSSPHLLHTYTGAHHSTYVAKSMHAHTHTHTNVGHTHLHTLHPHTNHTDRCTCTYHTRPFTHTHTVDGYKNMAGRYNVHKYTPGPKPFSGTASSSVCVTKTFTGVPFLFLPQPRLQRTHTHTCNYHLINQPSSQTSHQSGQRVINRLMATRWINNNCI